MKVYKIKQTIKSKILTRLKPNIWWLMTFVLIFILTVLFFSSTSKTVSSYPAFPTICIDAGHGGIDNGASGNGLLEDEINLEIATKLQAALEGLGENVVMTRTGDYGLYGTTAPGFKKRDMQERKRICEEAGSDMLISIHLNASAIPDRTGVVVYCNFSDENALMLANSIASQFDGGKVKDGDFYITTQIDTPSVIVECGFITTQSEAEKLCTSEYQEYLANSIARGILIYKRGLTS